MNRREIQKRFTTLNRRFEGKYLSPVKRSLMPTGLIEVIKSGGISAGINHLTFSVSNERLQAIIEKMYLEVGLRYARMNYRTMKTELVKKGFGFNSTWTQFIREFLQRFLIEKITFDVSTTTRDKLLEVLQEAINKGWGIDETVKNIEELPFLKFQAARIVRTEINRAANVGTKAQSETFPYEQMKEWISAHDTRVRGYDPKDHASHIGLDGIRINDGDFFQDPRNGDLLEFPGDVRASAESTINCRCSVAYVAKRDGNGRLIPKRKTTAVIFPNQNRQRQTVTI